MEVILEMALKWLPNASKWSLRDVSNILKVQKGNLKIQKKSHFSKETVNYKS